MSASGLVTEAGEPEQADLVHRARAGDSGAFELLYRQHSPRVFALCLRLSGGTREEAAELMQDVFIRAWRGLPGFRGESAFPTWLHKLAVNAMLQSTRSDRRRIARVLPVEDPSKLDAPSVGARPGEGIDIERAIASLPQGARVAFVLHEIEGYTHEEIGARLGIAAGTVKAQLHRARKLLIQALER